MNRRELLKLITAATGVAFVSSNALAYDILPKMELSDTGFNKDDVAFFNEIGETIIPKTDTPGAKDAQVGSMMAVLVADCYTKDQQEVFRKGMKSLKAKSQDKYGKDFLLLSKEQRLELLTALDKEAREYNIERELYGVGTGLPSSRGPESKDPVPHYFSLMKQLVLFSFFTSSVGATKVMRYEAVPGRYNGDMEYKKGDKAWATS
ncbi:gluconate 2-dehydrogenase subunit 3 family protein [Alteromonas pelagimontana]|uniref:Gluconate 2-dehydrogenase subunit 3 family protein n=1 Tax=Alteromonas pelagimontana TaxID=1858656 RepID=A0A6M4ME15_9ALTE|nr:gluconate 2-dehydrogenase subunit 3 family protein [Alteromonas pelagimontana]QJR81352.1 gluconate 2-dehydrogenase subunit 3 family protein [Alteromonas pelagimontana]